jgi:uncharacterized glyoxalase superfamily protein PhnB
MIMPLLTVTDVDASIAFYEKLGFKKQMAMPGPDGRTVFGIIELGKANFGLGIDPNVTTTNFAPGVEFMVYLTDDFDNHDASLIDTHFAKTQANGVAIKEGLSTAYWGDRIYKVVDPDGYQITIAQTVEQVNMEKVEAVMRGDAPTNGA